MSKFAARSLHLLVALSVSACVCGCVSADRYYQAWDLCPDTTGEQSGRVPDVPTAPGGSAKRIAIGMTKCEVREIADPLIDETSEYSWKLNGQFRPVRPGLYPFFDSRQVYLNFDDAGQLAAINVRGSYNVYP